MEQWRKVPGFEGLYEVSDLGRVRSLSHEVVRSNGRRMPISGKMRKTPIWRGYPTVVLHRNGLRENFSVHKLVAIAFIGPRPEGLEVAHWDGNTSNPKLTNLRYATPVENDADKIRHGTRPDGEKNGRARLSASDVNVIRERAAIGESQKSIRQTFDISSGHISLIINHRIWRSV